jgi:hypothetical protein
MKNELKSVRALAATLITFGSLAGGANGAITLSIYQDGSKVSMSTTGGLVDTTGLTTTTTGGIPNTILHGVANAVGFQQSNNSLLRFNGASLSTTGGFSYGVGGSSSALFTGSYNMIALQNVGSGSLYLGTGAITGLNSVSAVTATTVADATLAGLGFVEGSSLTMTWGADSVTVQVVPEPSSAALLSLGCFGLVFRRSRR